MTNTAEITWQDADTSTYSADSTEFNGMTITVCLDDEAVYEGTFAYYWDIVRNGTELYSGWASSVELAKQDSLIEAGALDV
jgi:hypothetical protein